MMHKSALKLRMEQPYAAHDHARRGRAGLNPRFTKTCARCFFTVMGLLPGISPIYFLSVAHLAVALIGAPGSVIWQGTLCLIYMPC